MSTELDPEILEEVRAILRRDLRLEPDAELPADMPFHGDEVDLDSLDMLLLVTSIERRFGIPIPNEAVGRAVFQNVTSLARFIQENRGRGPATPPPTDWLAQLPHRDPFRFVSKVLEVRPGESASGVWSLSGNEPFFAGHFPGNPIVPGVLITEALAQIAGIAGSPQSGREGRLAHVDVRFEQAVTPPVEIKLIATIQRTLGPLQRFEVSAEVAAVIVARGSITLHRAEAAREGGA